MGWQGMMLLEVSICSFSYLSLLRAMVYRNMNIHNLYMQHDNTSLLFMTRLLS